jgi:hypothetical protein
MSEDAVPPSVPKGVLACGCTTDVVDRLFERAGIARREQRPAGGSWAIVQAHIEQHLGPLQGVLHDADRDRLPIDLLIHGSSASGGGVHVVTAGGSAKRMRLPRSLRRRAHPARAEYLISLPAAWAGDRPPALRLLSRESAWMFESLKLAAHVPHELRWFFGDAPGLPTQRRILPLPRGASIPFAAVLFTNATPFGRHVPDLASPRHGAGSKRDRIRFQSLVPLHASEFETALDHGVQRLLDALRAAAVTDVIHVDRPPVC